VQDERIGGAYVEVYSKGDVSPALEAASAELKRFHELMADGVVGKGLASNVAEVNKLRDGLAAAGKTAAAVKVSAEGAAGVKEVAAALGEYQRLLSSVGANQSADFRLNFGVDASHLAEFKQQLADARAEVAKAAAVDTAKLQLRLEYAVSEEGKAEYADSLRQAGEAANLAAGERLVLLRTKLAYVTTTEGREQLEDAIGLAQQTGAAQAQESLVEARTRVRYLTTTEGREQLDAALNAAEQAKTAATQERVVEEKVRLRFLMSSEGSKQIDALVAEKRAKAQQQAVIQWKTDVSQFGTAVAGLKAVERGFQGVQAAIAPIGSIAQSAFGQAMSAMNSWVQAASPGDALQLQYAFADLAAVMGQIVLPVFRLFRDGVRDVAAWVYNFSDGTKALLGDLFGVTLAGAGLTAGFVALVAAGGAVASAVATLAGALAAVSAPVLAVGAVLAGYAAALAAVGVAVASTREGVALFGEYAATAGEAWGMLSDAFARAWATIQPALQEAWNRFRGFLGDLVIGFRSIKPMLLEFWQAVSDYVVALGPTLKSAIETMVTAFETLYDVVQKSVVVLAEMAKIANEIRKDPLVGVGQLQELPRSIKLALDTYKMTIERNRKALEAELTKGGGPAAKDPTGLGNHNVGFKSVDAIYNEMVTQALKLMPTEDLPRKTAENTANMLDEQRKTNELLRDGLKPRNQMTPAERAATRKQLFRP
jgi:hypothetical protein